jgi:outer membrane receptor for ferrienterochelin and colicins
MQGARFFLSGLSFCLLALAPAAPAFAESGEDIDKLLKMDIKQLAVISVASKKEESPYDAPSIVSVVTKDEISRYGARNLIDILDRIPSFQYTSGLFFQDNSFSARGQSTQHYANRMLFLINGRPFRDSFSGAFSTPLYTEFPVSTIERLEIIRGPGSVLYGSGAFSAVVNIVTRKAEGAGDMSAAATYGTHDYRDTELTAARSGPGWNATGAVRATDQHGWNTEITSELGTTGSFGKDENGHSFFGSAQFGNLSINAFQAKEVNDGLFRSFPTDRRDAGRVFFDVGYAYDVGERWQVAGNMTHNRLEFDTDDHLAGFRQYNSSADTLLELSARGKLNDRWNVLFGATHEFQEGTGFNTQLYNTQWRSMYGQVEYTPSRRLKLVAGLQMNGAGSIQEDFSPRGGAIYHFNDSWGSKLLYGQAFRSGYALETYLNIPGVIRSNAALKPEKVATTEAQLFYHDAGREGALTAYHSRSTNTIQRGPAVPGPGLTYLNGGKVEFHGVECEGKTRLGQDWEAQGSLLWQENEDGAGLDNVTYSPNWMAKAGISYRPPQAGYSVGLFDSYFSDPTPIRAFNPAVLEANPQPGSYHLVTLNAEFDLDKLIPGHLVPVATFTVFADNLLNENIYYPEYNRRNVNSLPVSLGRSIYGTLRIGF